jgi:hypothetical protein
MLRMVMGEKRVLVARVLVAEVLVNWGSLKVRGLRPVMLAELA